MNSLDYQLIYPASESQLPLKKYSELLNFLLDNLSDQYFVFYDRESTLEALRLALPRDRSVDVGLHVLLQNDALRAGGTIWNRSRSRLAPLKTLWEPILRTHVPENLVDRATGIMQLFKNFGASLAQPTTAGAEVLTATDNWRSRFGTELSLEDSLLLALESGASVERRRREAEAALEVINELQRGSAPFNFVFRGTGDINKRRVEALNALLKLVPHAGLTLLNMLLKSDLIASHAAREFIQLLQRRIEAKKKTKIVSPLNVTVSDDAALDRLHRTVINLLNYDDGRIADEAMTIGFPEFEYIELVSHARF